MGRFRKVVRGITPKPLRSAIWETYYGLKREWNRNYEPVLNWHIGSEHWQSVFRFSALKRKRDNERCFIIGNGPSLKDMDLTPLREEVTFGLNRIYMLFPKLGFQTTYYVAVNPLVIEQCAHEIEALPMPKFISWYTRDMIRFTQNTIFVRDFLDGTLGFGKNPAFRLWEGGTVTYVAMQIAFYLGYREVILIGVDHSFRVSGEPHSVVLAKGADQDHFDPNYFGDGFRWQLPDLEMSERAYKLAKSAFERDGRRILDATVGGKLEVLPKVDFKSLF